MCNWVKKKKSLPQALFLFASVFLWRRKILMVISCFFKRAVASSPLKECIAWHFSIPVRPSAAIFLTGRVPATRPQKLFSPWQSTRCAIRPQSLVNRSLPPLGPTLFSWMLLPDLFNKIWILQHSSSDQRLSMASYFWLFKIKPSQHLSERINTLGSPAPSSW